MKLKEIKPVGSEVGFIYRCPHCNSRSCPVKQEEIQASDNSLFCAMCGYRYRVKPIKSVKVVINGGKSKKSKVKPKKQVKPEYTSVDKNVCGMLHHMGYDKRLVANALDKVKTISSTQDPDELIKLILEKLHA